MRSNALVFCLLVASGCSPASTADAGVDAGSCSATTCSGCCQGDQCLAGDTQDACGLSGVACRACTATQSCSVQLGYAGCWPTPCPGGCDGGCCDQFTGTCRPGSERQFCGANGQSCRECNLQQYCISRLDEFTCASSSCPGDCDGGCCDSFTGACQPGTAQAACGSGGGWCRGCANSCVNQACQ